MIEALPAVRKTLSKIYGSKVTTRIFFLGPRRGGRHTPKDLANGFSVGFYVDKYLRGYLDIEV